MGSRVYCDVYFVTPRLPPGTVVGEVVHSKETAYGRRTISVNVRNKSSLGYGTMKLM
jgi:hypothetical protein